VKVAAYQATLLAAGSIDALGLIRAQVKRCEAEGVSILCCPEAILGGLADYSEHPARFAIAAESLDTVLAPLASTSVTTIVGFTELADGGRLHNSAAVFQRGTTIGVYRKLQPAIRHSVYDAGCEVPVFQIGELTFGIVIRNDSNFPEPIQIMAARGATALFVPTNNALPPDGPGSDLVAQARNVDIARAAANRIWIVRADVSGITDELVSYGSSGIVDPNGVVVRAACQMSDHLLVADIETSARTRAQPGS